MRRARRASPSRLPSAAGGSNAGSRTLAQRHCTPVDTRGAVRTCSPFAEATDPAVHPNLWEDTVGVPNDATGRRDCSITARDHLDDLHGWAHRRLDEP